MSTQQLSRPVRSYLRRLEIELKQLSGVHPEEALCDAREYLENATSEYRAEGSTEDDEIESLLIERFGLPSEVAQQYGEVADPGWQRHGFAPGWRVCCTKCGRSKPAAKSGFVRHLAYSKEKYVLGYCLDCRRLRWVRVIQDLDQSSLTDNLGMDRTASESLSRNNRPWLLVFGIVGAVLAINAVVWAILLQFVSFG